ncbi:hypothetical protein BDR07DRAFT_1019061 [Suillus spraguei]|nr:hypothetical protein BDR07DRAFT_1019061 [Suillus spraguei]
MSSVYVVRSFTNTISIRPPPSLLPDLFHGLQEQIATANAHDLALYTTLNINNFLKILKGFIKKSRTFHSNLRLFKTISRKDRSINTIGTL